MEIFRRLSAAMKFEEPELFESDREMIDTMLARTGLGIDFDELASKGTHDPFPDPVIPFEDGKFPTPSGCVEIASDRAEADGHPRVPQPSVDLRPADGLLRLLTPASEWLMNDSYGNDENVQRKLGEPCVYVCAEDAKSLGLEEGHAAIVSSDTGQIELQVAISDVVVPGVALAHKGRWPKLGSAGANVNVLNAGEPTDMGESTAVHGTRVRITPA
jgi:anaerobic selenocysteine-containing dehydrogenase